MKAPSFAPAGQSTQMIVGATAATDATILTQASSLYRGHGLRRVYYSAFSPIPDASSTLPLIAPPLVREHRLYQADWLMRFYGFHVGGAHQPRRAESRSDHRPETRVGAAAPGAVSRRYEQSAARFVAARSRTRRAERCSGFCKRAAGKSPRSTIWRGCTFR